MAKGTKTMTRQLLPLVVSVLILAFVSQNVLAQSTAQPKPSGKALTPKAPLVTFVELGSVNCIPCRMMQPVMRSIEQRYGSQVKVVFHDVWTEVGRPAASQYKIRVIPTQVFLDAAGKEFFRHEGFYPEAEIDKLLQKQGLKIQVGG
jgi:thioredoxin 1